MVSVASGRVWMGFDPRDRASQILTVVSALPGLERDIDEFLGPSKVDARVKRDSRF